MFSEQKTSDRVIHLSVLGVRCDPSRSLQLLVVAQAQRPDHLSLVREWPRDPIHNCQSACVFPAYPDLIAVAIRFEPSAFFPRSVDPLSGTVTYRRRAISVENALDQLRHRVLHTFCGSADGNQARVQGRLLFGIDAADCTPDSRDTSFWH